MRPLFWVEQKDRYLRQLLIRDIEENTGRRLVVYFANRYEEGSIIDARDSAYMAELLGDVGEAPVDMLVETNGGETDATELLITLIQHVTRDLRTVIANAAKSNGTLLCFASRCIVMGASSELGPIEPSLQGIPCTILAQETIAKQNFVLHQAGLVWPAADACARQSFTDFRDDGRNADRRKSRAPCISLPSCAWYYSHGSVISHAEATSLGLNIEYLQPSD